MDLKSFQGALRQIAEARGISPEVIIETLEAAIATAYKKDYGQKGQKIKAKFNPVSGDVKFWQVKLVVDESMLYTEEEIDELKIPLVSKQDYGRIAAQTAKQVILQKIREAEKATIALEYKSKEGEIISGVVQRVEGSTALVDIGKTLGILNREEQIPGEFYRQGQRLKLYILKVEETPKGSVVVLSRAYPKLVSRLFELEVPEIASGVVVIKSIAREPGYRTKMAVASNEERIDPIGSCVGQRGTRIMAVINELGGEKIDVILWQEDPEKFIANALSPAKIEGVKIEDKNTAVVFVGEDQLSLAIGKEGRNVRLAANLTGWKIDVKPAVKKETNETKETSETGEAVEKEKPKKKSKKVKEEASEEKPVEEKTEETK